MDSLETCETSIEQEDCSGEDVKLNGSNSSEVIGNESKTSDHQEPEHLRKIFIGGLNPSISDIDLRSYFEKWGKVLKANHVIDSASRKSLRYGFVTLNSSVVVDMIQRERPHNIRGQRVQVKRAMTKELLHLPDSKVDTTRLFVGGLTPEVRDVELRMYFEQFGKLKEAYVMQDKKSKNSRNFGFVSYYDHDIVDKILLIGNHVILGKTVTVKKAAERHELRAAPPDLRCVCGGRLKWGGPNMGKTNAMQCDACKCGTVAAQQRNVPGAGWCVSGRDSFLHGGLQSVPVMYGPGVVGPRFAMQNPPGLLPTPLMMFPPHGECERFDRNFFEHPPPPYQPTAPRAYQQQITDFNKYQYNNKPAASGLQQMTTFQKYKNSPFYDYDYECKLFEQAFPNGATSAQREAFFQKGIGRPPYACSGFN